MRREQAAIEALKQAGAKFSAFTGIQANIVARWVEEPPEDYDPIAKLVGRIGVPARYGPKDAQPLEAYEPLSRWLGAGFGQRLYLSRVTLRCSETDDPKALAAVEALATFDGIDFVQLQGPAFDDEALLHLRGLEDLEALSLRDAGVTGAGIGRLDGPLRIRALQFAEGEPSADLTESIVSLPWLIGLVLVDNAPVEEGAYVSLEKAEGLRALIALRSGFQDDDLTTIAKLPRLERLAVDGVTDAGLARLAPLKKLRSVDLYAPVTRTAAIRFSAERPGCLVRWTDLSDGPYELYRNGEPLTEDAVPHDLKPKNDPFWSFAP